MYDILLGGNGGLMPVVDGKSKVYFWLLGVFNKEFEKGLRRKIEDSTLVFAINQANRAGKL